MPRVALFLISLALCGCVAAPPVAPIDRPLSLHRAVEDRTTVELPGFYFCDHTCRATSRHAHPAGCSSHAACPPIRLRADATVDSGTSREGCAGARWGGTGAVPAVTPVMQRVEARLAELRSAFEAAARAEASAALPRHDAARQTLAGLLAGAARGAYDAGAVTAEARRQLLRRLGRISVTGGGSFGCGERREVGLRLEVHFQLQVDWTARLAAQVDDEGRLQRPRLSGDAALVSIRFSLPRVALLPGSGRKPTACACKSGG